MTRRSASSGTRFWLPRRPTHLKPKPACRCSGRLSAAALAVPHRSFGSPGALQLIVHRQNRLKLVRRYVVSGLAEVGEHLGRVLGKPIGLSGRRHDYAPQIVIDRRMTKEKGAVVNAQALRGLGPEIGTTILATR